MIRSLKQRALRKLFEDGDRRGVDASVANAIENILSVLNVATSPKDLDLPRLKLHQLRGDRRGYWAVTVRANWRIVFRFEDGNAFEVELIDYH